jgi:hypothetical protein
VNQPAITHEPQPTKAALPFANGAFIATKGAADALGMPRRLNGQVELSA